MNENDSDKSEFVSPEFEYAEGSRLITTDNRKFVDMDCRSGAVILGHANEQVVTALTKASRNGLATMSESRLQGKLAALVQSAFSGFDATVFGGSPLSALMSAMHAARELTGRQDIVSIGSHTSDTTIECDFNDHDSVRAIFDNSAIKPAAVVITPICVDYGISRPSAGFLGELRELCTTHGSVLIFDERITGFRLTYGCAQSLYEIQPDVSVLGGAIGGGMAMGAILATAQIADHIEPQPLKANPLAMACGLATLEPLRDGAVYGRLEAIGASLGDGLNKAAAESKADIKITRSGSMIAVTLDNDNAKHEQLYTQLRQAMLVGEVYLPPMAQSPWFVTAAHQDKDIAQVVAAATEAFKQIES